MDTWTSRKTEKKNKGMFNTNSGRKHRMEMLFIYLYILFQELCEGLLVVIALGLSE